MKLEESIAEFDRLKAKAALMHAVTWCVRIQALKPTVLLSGEKCVKCPEFVVNGGVCDPL